MRNIGECFLTLCSCFFELYPRRSKRNSKIQIKSPADIPSTGVILILGKRGSSILAVGGKPTWLRGASESGLVVHTRDSPPLQSMHTTPENSFRWKTNRLPNKIIFCKTTGMAVKYSGPDRNLSPTPADQPKKREP